ncbi:TonB-dependent receptor plug domain-containing protein [Methyloversatilis thermotolerans]|uniref:TonB-dependent receptor plug domain-containing protein n=1 Tax=Methyloversatilis thermotolerans TaxID=1346290 RepID=UPI000366D63C|nr:TonB-dependent receptor [Methyloversatilis thermotolerans]
MKIRIALSFSVAAFGVATAATAADLADLELEELLQVEVSTAARKVQALRDTPAAAFVISREDIARSGAASVPELLQMVPGAQVGRIASNTWAVSLRGANGRFANKLQVRVDGRSVYTPLFSGTVWADRDLMLEDIERIEVVRGPGGALWGSNAMNGVINIITRRPADTQGGLMSAAAGSEQRGWLAARQGFSTGEGQHGRVWAKRRLLDAGEREGGSDGFDSSRGSVAGFNWEGALAGGARLLLSGGMSESVQGNEFDFSRFVSGARPTTGRIETRENHLMGRYGAVTGPGAEYSLQVSLTDTAFRVDNPAGPVDDDRQILDIDFQRREVVSGGHDLIWGAGYRRASDDTSVNFIGGEIFPSRRISTLASVFIQDDISLTPERLNMVIGLRVEDGNQDSAQLQPTLRLMYTPEGGHSLWAAVSRTTREPSRAMRDLRVAIGPVSDPAFAGGRIVRSTGGGESLRSETATSLEAGYRFRRGPLSLDAVAYLTRYRHQAQYIVLSDEVQSLPQPTAVSTYALRSIDESRAHGLELAADYRVAADWSLHAAYTWSRATALTRSLPSEALASIFIYAGDARHRLSLRSLWNFAPRWQFDVWLRAVSEVEPGGPGGYTDADIRLAWRARPDLELSLTGQNLLHARRLQYRSETLPESAVLIERGAFAKAVWSF